MQDATTSQHDFRGQTPPTGSVASLMALHDRDVRSALRRVLGRSQEEDDLVQEVFVRLVIRLRQPGDLCVGAWLRGVAHNLAVDEIRRRRPVPVEETRLDAAVASPVDEHVAGSELYSHLVEGARGLPDRQRAALASVLCGDAGPGVAGVAARLGVSVHAAESLISRARSGLREHLAMAGSDSGTLRVRVGTAVAAVATVMAWAARHWRAATVATAVAAGAVTTVVALPSVAGPTTSAPATVGRQVTGAAVPGVVSVDAPPHTSGPSAAPAPAAGGAPPAEVVGVAPPVAVEVAAPAAAPGLELPVGLPCDMAVPVAAPAGLEDPVAVVGGLLSQVVDAAGPQLEAMGVVAAGPCVPLPALPAP